jgi:Mg2+-importing ATPase
MSDVPFWQHSIDDLNRQLGASPQGLSTAEAARRLTQFGLNESNGQRRAGFGRRLLRRLGNPLVAMLIVASTIAGISGDLVSFATIVLVVALSTTLDMVQEHRAEQTAEALKHSIALRATAVRDGRPQRIQARELVPGDVVQLTAGDLVPADGLLIEANNAQVNEAALTGEPYPVAKQPGTSAATSLAEAANALFTGGSMLCGTATMLVVATGRTSQFGGIAASLAKSAPPTAFERELHRFGLLIVRLTLFLVLFVLFAHLALGRPPLQSFLFAMALAVGLTPELLPMIMTIALARGAQRMAAAKVVVKRLSAIHDLGQMDVLCTDKTGTLTAARIALIGHPGIDGEDDEQVLLLAAVNARFESGLRSPLDEALLQHTAAHQLDDWTKLDERPFDFQTRRVAVLADHPGGRLEIVKGAPEAILALCQSLRQRSGVVGPLDQAARGRLEALCDGRAAEGQRLLGIAYRPADREEKLGGDSTGYIFAGYCAFVDPPKESATAAIERLAAAGIRIKVISGDAPAVVHHLVGALGLPIGGMLTGEELARLDDTALAARVDTVDLYARITPDQKTRIVRALRSRGHTVGFVGDGINDAPAIHAAHVGLSVDDATDVAREAADMILLAPDLGVLADGVAEGRRTYANILKYIRMGTSSNFGNMLTMAIASLWLPFLPLTPVQVLLNNLIYDLSQVGIPFDHEDPEDLAAPHRWDMRALLRFTAIMGALSTLFDLVTFILLVGPYHAAISSFRTVWFIESMATQILVVFVIRTTRRAWRSRPHPALVASALTCLATATVLPLLPLARILGFAFPGWPLLGVIVLVVAGYLLAAEALKPLAIAKEKARPARMPTAP